MNPTFAIVFTTAAATLICSTSASQQLPQNLSPREIAAKAAVNLPFLEERDAAAVSKFSGRWTYSDSMEYDGKVMHAFHELLLFQKRDHICGCWRRFGIPLNREEYYLLEGRVSGDVLDVLVDKGFTGNYVGDYAAKYPFEPEYGLRFKKTRKGLIEATFDMYNAVKNGFPSVSQTVYGVTPYKFNAPSDPAMCEEPEVDWGNFYKKCAEQE